MNGITTNISTDSTSDISSDMPTNIITATQFNCLSLEQMHVKNQEKGRQPAQ